MRKENTTKEEVQRTPKMENMSARQRDREPTEKVQSDGLSSSPLFMAYSCGFYTNIAFEELLPPLSELVS